MLTEKDWDLPSTPGSTHNSLGRKSQGSINASLSQPSLYLDAQIQRYKAVLPPETFERIASENEEKFQKQLKRVMSLHVGLDEK